MDERQQLKQAIAAQESLRGTLDDAIIDATISMLKEKLAALDHPPQQQRKLATILFVDIVGSTRLTQGMDPEEQMALIDPLLGRMAEKVDDHGGHVSRYQGDGFKAVFGLPVAHENDPAQAIRAGLAIQAEAAQIAEELERKQGLAGFQVRVGIATGLVFSGGETEGEDTIKGEAVNLAARLESAAQPGTVLISHDSYKHVRGIFDLEPLEPVEVKGFSAPVAVYQVLRAKERPFYRGMRGVEGVETRMVGRELEFLQLQKVMRDVIEEGEGQMVTVVGDAGLGKSRLMYEFENWADLLPEQVWLYKGRARLETQNLPYGLLRDMFAFRFGIQEDDRAQVVQDKLEKGFAEGAWEGEASEKQAHILGQLLGYGFEDSPHLKGVRENPQQVRDQAMMYMAEYFRSFAGRNPVLVLFEDLHWADDSSLDAINFLTEELKTIPVLFLGTTRHSLLERRPHWGEGQDFHQNILLKPLSKRESRNLVVEVLQKVQDVPEALSDLVVGNAEGNPFYVEELIKMLVEDGVIVRDDPHWRVEVSRLQDVHVPSTLTGVLQARLDGLPEEERKALQGASVVGRVFWDRILEYINRSLEERITDGQVAEVLDELRSRELIFRRETSSFAEASEHIFKHALLREVTYESVLKRVRQAYHALVAEWLIEHAGDREGEFTGLIADHLEQAGSNPRAGHYLLQAGKHAAQKYANQEAVSYLSRALALTEASEPEKRYTILREREQIYDLIGNRQAQEADISIMETTAEELGHRTKQAETALRFANFAEQISDLPRCLQAAQKAIRIAQETGNLEQEAAGLLAWGRGLWRNQELDQAKPKFKMALEVAKKTGNQQLVGHALRNLGIIAGEQKNFTLQHKYYQESLALYREIGDQSSEAIAMSNLGTIYHGQFDYRRASDYYSAALALSLKTGYKILERVARANLAELHFFFGEYQKAWDAYEQNLPISRRLNAPMHLMNDLFQLSIISGLFYQDYQKCRMYAEEGLSIAKEKGDMKMEAFFLSLMGISLTGLQKWAEAEEHYKKPFEILTENDFQEDFKFLWARLAHLYLAQGNLDQAVQEVNLVLEDLDANGIEENDFWKISDLHFCCQVLQAANDPRYLQVLRTAYNHLQSLVDKIKPEEMRSSILNNMPWNKGIMELWEAEQEKNEGNQS